MQYNRMGDDHKGVRASVSSGPRGKYRFFPPKIPGGPMDRRREEKDILKPKSSGDTSGVRDTSAADPAVVRDRATSAIPFRYAPVATVPQINKYWKPKASTGPGTKVDSIEVSFLSFFLCA